MPKTRLQLKVACSSSRRKARQPAIYLPPTQPRHSNQIILINLPSTTCYGQNSCEGRTKEKLGAFVFTIRHVFFFIPGPFCPSALFFFLFVSSHLFSLPYFPSSLPFITQIRGYIAGGNFSPPPLLRYAPSFLSRREFRIFLPRRLASNRFTHAAKRYLLVRFCARTSPLTRFSLTQSILVVTRLNHYHRRDRLGGTKD